MEDDDMGCQIITLLPTYITLCITISLCPQEELKSTFVRQNFLVLKDDRRISEAVQPQKWEVLIRILDAPEVDPNEDRQSSHTATSQGLSAGGYQTRR